MTTKTTKKRHNKKRNTAFLYEALMVELTKAILSENHKRKNSIIELLSVCFSSGTDLNKDLGFYKSLNETSGLDPYTAEKLIFEIKSDRNKNVDQKRLFNEQTALIGLINRRLSKNVFSNFVPGYKNLATIAQIFNQDTTTKKRVLLEKELIERLVNELATEQAPEKIVQIDNLVYKTFTQKFNNKYNNSLLSEQKKLLSNYIMSFADNGVGLKIFVGDELSRIQKTLQESTSKNEDLFTGSMKDSVKEVENMINEFKEHPIDERALKKILKMQTLINEIKS
tara:strand:+ start:284 stop:1129 length:846 start_codon:yes stop_codon:yes gene_type:complete